MTGRRLAAERIEASAVPVDLVGLDGEELPLGDASVDGAISTFTLCTIPDAGRALRELRRVLRPGAQLHFLEHGLSPDPPVAKWQQRLTPLQRRVAGGCHFDRPIQRPIAEAGPTLTQHRNHYKPGPKTFRYL